MRACLCVHVWVRERASHLRDKQWQDLGWLLFGCNTCTQPRIIAFQTVRGALCILRSIRSTWEALKRFSSLSYRIAKIIDTIPQNDWLLDERICIFKVIVDCSMFGLAMHNKTVHTISSFIKCSFPWLLPHANLGNQVLHVQIVFDFLRHWGLWYIWHMMNDALWLPTMGLNIIFGSWFGNFPYWGFRVCFQLARFKSPM